MHFLSSEKHSISAFFSVWELQPPAFALDIEKKVSAPKIKAHEVLIGFISFIFIMEK